MNKTLKAIELFAGVGGFHLGLKKPHFEVVWSNQWEPATKAQHASDIYVARFGEKGHSNKDISTVDIKEIRKETRKTDKS
jgi:DNA (cytosine-5)-methyltransferase 1